MKSGQLHPSTEQFEAALLKFITSELVPGSQRTIDATTQLFKAGVIDSLKILRLLAFLESVIGRPIPDDEIVMKHFQSVRAMAEHFLTAGNES
jgi:acyl carrier protein